MYTKKQLYEQLSAMGVPKDRVVLCHTSMRAVGEVEGGAEGLLDVLISYVTEDGGLLCIPTHTWAYLKDPSRSVTMDMTSTETCIGVLPSIAAGRPDGHRSEHPTHSMVVFGDAEKAEAYIAGEELVDTATSPKGCYGKLPQVGGYVLLIGVGQERNTFLHAAEEIIGVQNRLSKELNPATIRRKDGTLVSHPVHCHCAEGLSGFWNRYPKYEPAFRYAGCITDGMLGNASCQLCAAKGMVDMMEKIRTRSGGIELLGDDTPFPQAYYED